jgi:hypothetical protein
MQLSTPGTAFNGPALGLRDDDVRTIAGYLGCQIAAVRAVLQIEAAGKGFDGKGRPKMLFEPHIFYRELGAGAKRNRAVSEGLAYAKWKPGAYPSDSYPRLTAAIAIDETAALRSASWGAGQVMGFNHKAAGFDTVQTFVQAMTVSEGAHLYAMARFIVTNKLQRHLRDLNWTGFARGYNGAGYAQNGYHTKLRAAYAARPAGEKITPPVPSDAELRALYSAPAPTPKPAPQPLPPVPFPRREKPEAKPGFWAWLIETIFRKK